MYIVVQCTPRLRTVKTARDKLVSPPYINQETVTNLQGGISQICSLFQCRAVTRRLPLVSHRLESALTIPVSGSLEKRAFLNFIAQNKYPAVCICRLGIRRLFTCRQCLSWLHMYSNYADRTKAILRRMNIFEEADMLVSSLLKLLHSILHPSQNIKRKREEIVR